MLQMKKLFIYFTCFLCLIGCQKNDIQVHNGNNTSLNKLDGSWVVINYWADWCPPCLKEMPELVEFSNQNSTVSEGQNFLNADNSFLKDSDEDELIYENSQCYSNIYSEYIGKNLDDFYGENTISLFLRIIHPEQVVSYDYMPERLNVQIDMSEKITRFYCG